MLIGSWGAGSVCASRKGFSDAFSKTKTIISQREFSGRFGNLFACARQTCIAVARSSGNKADKEISEEAGVESAAAAESSSSLAISVNLSSKWPRLAKHTRQLSLPYVLIYFHHLWNAASISAVFSRVSIITPEFSA